MVTQLPTDLDRNDEDLVKTFTRMQMFGKFSVRYNLQAYLIKDCSTRAINVLLANKVPVFISLSSQIISILSGYSGLRSDGECIFINNYKEGFEAFSITHRELMAVMIILPKPGKKGGISQEYLAASISRYRNDWDKTPSLVEISQGFLDIITSGLGN